VSEFFVMAHALDITFVSPEKRPYHSTTGEQAGYNISVAQTHRHTCLVFEQSRMFKFSALASGKMLVNTRVGGLPEGYRYAVISRSRPNFLHGDCQSQAIMLKIEGFVLTLLLVSL